MDNITQPSTPSLNFTFQDHPRSNLTSYDTFGLLIYDFLLVLNCKICPNSTNFRDINVCNMGYFNLTFQCH